MTKWFKREKFDYRQAWITKVQRCELLERKLAQTEAELWKMQIDASAKAIDDIVYTVPDVEVAMDVALKEREAVSAVERDGKLILGELCAVGIPRCHCAEDVGW